VQFFAASRPHKQPISPTNFAPESRLGVAVGHGDPILLGPCIDNVGVGPRDLLLGVAADHVHPFVLRRCPRHFVARDRQRRGINPSSLAIGFGRWGKRETLCEGIGRQLRHVRIVQVGIEIPVCGICICSGPQIPLPSSDDRFDCTWAAAVAATEVPPVSRMLCRDLSLMRALLLGPVYIHLSPRSVATRLMNAAKH
jgi:hypothetical protein